MEQKDKGKENTRAEFPLFLTGIHGGHQVTNNCPASKTAYSGRVASKILQQIRH